jgi:hypothetical protein
LLSQLEAANDALQKTADELNRKIELLKKELATLEKERDHQAIPMLLANEELGNPALLDRQWALASAVQFASARVQAASEGVAKYEHAIRAAKQLVPRPMSTQTAFVRYDGSTPAAVAEPAAIPIYERRLRRWRIELELAQQAMTEARAAGDAIHRELLDE